METEDTPKGEPPILLSDLLRFLEANGVNTECPHCRSSGWDANLDDPLEGAALPRLGPDALVYPESILPCLALACSNCAYVWLIARKRVARWLGEHPEGAA